MMRCNPEWLRYRQILCEIRSGVICGRYAHSDCRESSENRGCACTPCDKQQNSSQLSLSPVERSVRFLSNSPLLRSTSELCIAPLLRMKALGNRRQLIVTASPSVCRGIVPVRARMKRQLSARGPGHRVFEPASAAPAMRTAARPLPDRASTAKSDSASFNAGFASSLRSLARTTITYSEVKRRAKDDKEGSAGCGEHLKERSAAASRSAALSSARRLLLCCGHDL
jgi:hypothetical protein